MIKMLSQKTLDIWRAVVDAGPAGISSKALHETFRHVYDGEHISAIVQSLHRHRYLHREGVNRYGMWMVNDDCQTPKGEDTPAWVTLQAEPDDPLIVPRKLGCEKGDVVLPLEPASVFSMAMWPLANDVAKMPTVRSAVKPAMPAQPAQEQRVVLDWVAPAATEHIDADAPASAAETSADAPDAERFVCSLDNEGDLFMHSNGQELTLRLTHTRKLLRYLDHLCAADVIADAVGEAA